MIIPDDLPKVPVPTAKRGETLQYKYGEMLAYGADCYAAGRASLVPLLEQAFDALECAKPSILKKTYPRAMKALEAALKEIKSHD